MSTIKIIHQITTVTDRDGLVEAFKALQAGAVTATKLIGGEAS